MIRLLLALLLLAVALPAGAQRRAVTPPAAPTPALWQVKDADTTVTLFGTVHALPRGIDWFRPHVVAALDSADRLVLETIPPQTPGSLMPVVMRLARQPAARPLAERVPESHRPALEAAIASLKPPPLERYDSWYVALTLGNLQAEANGLDPRIGVEAVLAERARLRNKPVEALETAEQQLIYFDALPESDQQALLLATLEDLPTSAARTDRMVADWLYGNTDALAALINREAERSPMLMRMLVNDRNARWAAWIADQMKRPGHLFVAVGAGHLAGPASLQVELAKRGLVAERVSAPPPRRRRAR